VASNKIDILSLARLGYEGTVKKLVCLFVCLSLSLFAVARATKPGQTLAVLAKANHKKQAQETSDPKNSLDAYAELESFAMSEAEEEEPATGENTDEGVASADDGSTQDASDDKGEDVNTDDDGDDEGADDNSGADDSGNDDGDHGGG